MLWVHASGLNSPRYRGGLRESERERERGVPAGACHQRSHQRKYGTYSSYICSSRRSQIITSSQMQWHNSFRTTSSSLLRLILHFIYMYLSFYFFPAGILQAKLIFSMSSVAKVRLRSEKSLRLLFVFSKIQLYYFFIHFASKVLKMFVGQWSRDSSLGSLTWGIQSISAARPSAAVHPLSKVWKTAGILKAPALY